MDDFVLPPIRPLPTPTTCRFYQTPDGCKNGDRCPYPHSAHPASPVSRGTSVSAQIMNRGPGLDQRKLVKMNRTAPVPRGACIAFWQQGRCYHEFKCKYEHQAYIGSGEAPPASTLRPALPWQLSSATTQSPSTNPAVVTTIPAPYFSPEGILNMKPTTVDGFFERSSLDDLHALTAKNLLAKYLQVEHRFKSTGDVYNFLHILNAANIHNTGWDQQDGQLFIDAMSSEGATRRITQVIQWAEVSTQAGTDKRVLSFQRGYVPLFRYWSSDFVLKSTRITQVNMLYDVIYANIDRLYLILKECLEVAIAEGSFVDRAYTNPQERIEIGLFISLATIAYELLTRVPNARSKYRILPNFARSVRRWYETWKADLVSGNPTFEEQIPDMDIRDHILGVIDEKFRRINSFLDRTDPPLPPPTVPPQVDAEDDAIFVEADEGSAQDHTEWSWPDDPKDKVEGPGILRPAGPRHDNDHVHISDIRIAPTHAELLCDKVPFLPGNFPSADHHLDSNSVERLLDVQFRLLREELIAPLRSAVQTVCKDLQTAPFDTTELFQVFAQDGGRYRPMEANSTLFNIYTGVEFVNLSPDWKGIGAVLRIDTPVGRARTADGDHRAQFWDSIASKRLFQGGVLALVCDEGAQEPRREEDLSVHVGIIVSPTKELQDHARVNQSTIQLRVLFFDPEINFQVVRDIRGAGQGKRYQGRRFLVESPVLFDSIRPFLDALCKTPEDLPFARYLIPQPDDTRVDPPKYATRPGFYFQLGHLFDDDVDLRMRVDNPESIEEARQALTKSRLDPSQADAVLDALTREVVLIQGPPGTGKSFTGVEILRILVAHKIGPILLMAYTNHALDHLLTAIIDAGITEKIVRLGTRTAESRIIPFTITKREESHPRSRLEYDYRGSNARIWKLRKEIEQLMEDVGQRDVTPDKVAQYLMTEYPDYYVAFVDVSPCIAKLQSLAQTTTASDDSGFDQWQTVGTKGKTKTPNVDLTSYTFWKTGGDLEYIGSILSGVLRPWVASSGPLEDRFEDAESETDESASSSSDSDSDAGEVGDEEEWAAFRKASLPVQERWKQVGQPNNSAKAAAPFSPLPLTTNAPKSILKSATLNPPLTTQWPDDNKPEVDIAPEDATRPEMLAYFISLGFDNIPVLSTGKRTLDELLALPPRDVWTLSLEERQTLHAFWSERLKTRLSNDYEGMLSGLQTEYAEQGNISNESRQEIRRDVLDGVDIIGCTTTGAAQLPHLLKGLDPRVLVVEEAGQVLEAHILGTLVPSIEHLILVGDPQQLRPVLRDFKLSIDSREGRARFRFDMSLMERLASSGFPMSQIDVQRRMRPDVSSMIRNTLYPRLIDHPIVLEYPPVRGVPHNVFFLHHEQAENDGLDDAVSKYNTYEVDMVKDLVLYFLQQGCYTDDGDIVVLCAYLGQLARLRDALENETIIMLDERDEADLRDREAEFDAVPGGLVRKSVQVSTRVRLRTIDNYQGEEGRVVILSTVRNSGPVDPLEIGHRRENIGFLKSENRINVALSRAKEGLFILGNARDLSNSSRMWQSVIKDLDHADAVKVKFPIACYRHPDDIRHVSKPAELSKLAPQGGCLRQCEMALECGHACPQKCHPDNLDHVAVDCVEKCLETCVEGHPCNGVCGKACPPCTFVYPEVVLSCGHKNQNVECGKQEPSLYCAFETKVQLLTCEHRAFLRCGGDIKAILCLEACDATLGCCGQLCKSPCHECQSASTTGASSARDPDGQATRVSRTSHAAHPCQKRPLCGHPCRGECSTTHQHTLPCEEVCWQSCMHQVCAQPCSTVCTPCQRECEWTCPHHSCTLPCGFPCLRAPCEQRCTTFLACGHQCPSVCGEDCGVQTCPVCTPSKQTTDSMSPRTALITVPSCGHIFTVASLDQHVGISKFYVQDDRGNCVDVQRWDGPAPLPLCPSCRGPVLCRRYGRIWKQFRLDVLKRNTITEVFSRLSHARRSLSTLEGANTKESDRALRERLYKLRIPASHHKSYRLSASKRHLNHQVYLQQARSRDDVLIVQAIGPGNVRLHALHPDLVALWAPSAKSTTALFRIVSNTHISFAQSDVWAALPPREAAKAGPQPLFPHRCAVQAIWTSLDIRLFYLSLAQTFLSELAALPASSLHPNHLDNWASYIDFLIKTGIVDATKALKHAETSGATRQTLLSTLYVFEFEFEGFRLGAYMCQRAGILKSELIAGVGAAKKDLEARVSAAKVAYFEERTRTSLSVELHWVRENFERKAKVIARAWDELATDLQEDRPVVFTPVRVATVKGRLPNLATDRSFLVCPIGHVVFESESTSICPECGRTCTGEPFLIEWPESPRTN